MDAVDILKVCLRRWYIMLPILLGAAGVSLQLVQAQQTSFTAYASYGLVQTGTPSSGAGGGVTNPLGANDGALIGAALEAQLNSRETQAEIGGDATRGWGPGEAANGSFFKVEIPLYETTYEVRAWGGDEQAVRKVVNRVIDAAPGIADQLQDRAGAPATGRYQPFILAPTQAEALPSASGKKLVVAVMGIGVLMGAAWSIVAERILRQVERRRTANRTETDAGLRPGASGREEGTFDGPVPSRSTEPEAPPEESSAPRAQERAEAGSRPDRQPVMTPAAASPRTRPGTASRESGAAPNGQRRPKGKARGGNATTRPRAGGG